MVTAPLRETGSGLLATRNVMVPSPCPCAPEVIATHSAPDAADHGHSLATVTAIELAPPSGPNERGEASKLGWQRPSAVEGAVTLVVADPPQAATQIERSNAIEKRSRATGFCRMHIRRQSR